MSFATRLFTACLALRGFGAVAITELRAEKPAKIHADLVYEHKDELDLVIGCTQCDWSEAARCLTSDRQFQRSPWKCLATGNFCAKLNTTWG